MPDWNGNRLTSLICDTAGLLRRTGIAIATAAGDGAEELAA